MSRHRRRSPGRRRASRRNGFLAPVTALAVTVITGIAIAGYAIVHSRQSNLGAAIAAAAVPSSRAMAVLEQQRQQMIVMDAAAHTMDLVSTPKVAARPTPPGGGAVAISYPPPNPGSAQQIAYDMMSSYGWNPKTYFGCLNNIWTRESNWLYNAQNASGAYGIPQALPGDKMASAGPNWQTDPTTQIKWGLSYIQSTYGNPCNAWAFWQAHSYY